MSKKSLKFPLNLGILLFPFIFAWFTLRQGHNILVRILSFSWLVLYLTATLFIAIPAEADPESSVDSTLAVDSTGTGDNLNNENSEQNAPKANLKIRFKSNSINDSNKAAQDIIIFKSDYRYCQEQQELIRESFEFTFAGQTNTWEFIEGDVFCVLVNETYGTFENRVGKYGPFIAVPECAYNADDTNPKFFTIEEGPNFYPPSSNCLFKNNTSYNNVKMTAKVEEYVPVNQETRYSLKYQVKINYPICEKISEYSEEISDNMLIKLVPNGEPVIYDSNVMIANVFCAFIYIYNTANDKTEVAAGPFQDSTGLCQLTYNFGKGIYANDNCTGSNMVSIKNTDKEFNGVLIDVRIRNRDKSDDCSEDSKRGGTVAFFQLWPQQLQNILISDVGDSEGEICTEVTEMYRPTQYGGPFKAKKGCKLKVSSINQQIITDEINGVHTCGVQ
jgi:hypothetical protein